MKTKDIKKIIKLNIESNIPENAPSIDFPFARKIDAVENKRFHFSFKFAMSALFAVFVIVLGFAFWPNNGIDPTPPAKLLNSNNEIVSFSAISSVSLLSTIGTNELISLSTDIEVVVEQPTVIKKVLPYLRSIEQLLLSESGLNIISGESDMPEYDFYMQFETKNLANISTVYVMHYNLDLVDEDDEESEYTIEGILLLGNKTYFVTGKKEIEDDEEKVEFKAFLDESNYVESLYKIENDKQVFEFTVIQNNLLVSESKYEIEFDNHEEIKVKLSFTEGNNEGEYEFEYYSEDDVNLIKIHFDTKLNNIESSGEMIVQMVVDEITGNTRYLIYVDPDDGDEYEYETEEDDDDDEDDEDDENEEDNEESEDEEDEEDEEDNL